MPIAPLILASLLPGCPGGECVGPGCEDVYSAAMVSVFQGQADSLGKRLDPFEDAWFSLTGSEAMGPGWSVTASGNTLVVGAPDLGAVLIFHLEGRQEGILGGQALVLPDLLDDQDDTRLGASVLTMDMDSDGQRELLVTAPAARGEGDAVKAGRLYVFETSGHFARPLFDTAIPPQLGTDDAGLTVLGANAYDKSGSQISACGDFDGDGLGEVAISALWDEQGGAALAGSVTLLSSKEISSALTANDGQAMTLTSLGATFYATQVGASAGASLSCAQDLVGGALPDLAVGAPFADSDEDGLEAAGAVWIVDGDLAAAKLDKHATLELDDAASVLIHGPTSEAYLGSSLAVGDVSGDGTTDLLAGAPGAGGQEQGMALLYTDLARDTAQPSPALRFRGEASGDRFGSSVALADLNGDGLDEIIAGAPRHNPSGADEHFASGATYCWYGQVDLSGWDSTSDAGKAPTVIEREQAWLLTGETLAVGDMDGDGMSELVLVHRILPDF